MPIHEKNGKISCLRRFLSAFLIAFLGGIFLALPVPALAHPPKDVSLAYDGRVLSVTITHSSFFPSKHYVKGVAISINGKAVSSTPYTNQPAGDSFTYTYPVPAAPGDVISVNAACNIFGSKEGSFTVPK